VDNEDVWLLATRGSVLLLLLTKEACLCGNREYSLPEKSGVFFPCVPTGSDVVL